MKFNKKILIPLISTAMGLSVIGGIAGAFAWYQYNSKVNISFVGASVADVGVLQLGQKEKMVDENGDPVMDDPVSPAVQKETSVWGREFTKEKTDHLIPVTFGACEKREDPVLDENGDPTGDTVDHYILPNKAYSYPEAGSHIWPNRAAVRASLELFLCCLAYGYVGRTRVTLSAPARFSALTMVKSIMIWSLTEKLTGSSHPLIFIGTSLVTS